MDILASRAYSYRMISRLITTLAILAITVATTVSSAHATRMSIGSGSEHTAHAVEMMPSQNFAHLACDSGQHCGPADAEMCEFVCTSLSAFLTSPDGQAKHFHGSANNDIPSDSIHVNHAPELNERPPKLRLL